MKACIYDTYDNKSVDGVIYFLGEWLKMGRGQRQGMYNTCTIEYLININCRT